MFGCILRGHKYNCPWSRTQAKHRMCGIITPPSILQRMERKGEGRRPGGWRGLLKGSLQSGLANDNRCKFVSSRALEGCRLRHTYCKRGIAPCVRVHFVRTQVQLPLDQMEVCRKRVCEDTNAADLGSNIEFIDRDQRA